MDSEETPKEEKEVDVHTKEEMLIFIEEPHGFIDLQMFGSSCTYEEPELFYEHEHTGNYGQLDDMVKERYCPSQWLEYEPKDSQLKILNYETDHDAPAMSRDKYIY